MELEKDIITRKTKMRYRVLYFIMKLKFSFGIVKVI